MNPIMFYQNLYRRLRRVTPLKADCGRLCGAICCQDLEEGAGMYLYPGEEALFSQKDAWAKISGSDFCVDYKENKFAKILQCPGTCDRAMRPLACRIFPLVPYIEKKTGALLVVVDPRAKAMCPLASAFALDDFDAEFVTSVQKASNALYKVRQTRAFLWAQSRLIDRYCKELYL